MPDAGAAGSGVGSPARIDRQADAGGWSARRIRGIPRGGTRAVADERRADRSGSRLHPRARTPERGRMRICVVGAGAVGGMTGAWLDRKSTRLNSSHTVISYAVFCLKKKNTQTDAPATRRTSERL